VSGKVKIAPTRLSKFNTFLEFSVLILVMAATAGWIAGGVWLRIAFIVVFATIIGSAAQYAWLWIHKRLA